MRESSEFVSSLERIKLGTYTRRCACLAVCLALRLAPLMQKAPNITFTPALAFEMRKRMLLDSLRMFQFCALNQGQHVGVRELQLAEELRLLLTPDEERRPAQEASTQALYATLAANRVEEEKEPRGPLARD